MSIRHLFLILCVTTLAGFASACDGSSTSPGARDAPIAASEDPAVGLTSVDDFTDAELAAMDLSATASMGALGSAQGNILYTIVARDARLNREVLGAATDDVQGVPAEPVDAFVWDGVGSTPVSNAVAVVRLDPEANTGVIRAQWTDENGSWTFTQTMFAAPDHPSGARVGPSVSDVVLVQGDPIPTDVYLHGNTTAGGPVLPTLFNHVATWGAADVSLNGEPFLNPYDGPAPRWVAHTMTSEGARMPDGTVRTVSGDIFDFSVADQGAVTPDDLEFHLVFHDAPGPATDNVPPPFSFFYHLTFEDVKMKVKQP